MFRNIAIAALVVQTISFFPLGLYFFHVGVWRLGVAQILLAAVTAVVYSGGIQ